MENCLPFKDVVKSSYDWINTHPDQNFRLRETSDEEKACCGGTHVLVRRRSSDILICVFHAPTGITNIDVYDNDGNPDYDFDYSYGQSELVEHEWKLIRSWTFSIGSDLEQTPSCFFE